MVSTRLIAVFAVVRSQMDTTVFLLEDLLVLIVYLLCLFLFIALCMFFTFHMNVSAET